VAVCSSAVTIYSMEGATVHEQMRPCVH